MAERSGAGFIPSFGGLLASVMIALKLKDRSDDYKQISTEEEGRVALGPGPPPAYRDQQDIDGVDAEAIGLINTEIRVSRPKRQRSKCCVCCGLNCTLFWKAFGIVVAIFAVWNAFKLIRWAVTPSPTGLENMPLYSTSLGCMAAPYVYNGKMTSFNVPIGVQNADHGFDVRGGAVGTILVLEGAPTATKVKYEVTLRTDNRALLDDLIFTPTPDEDGSSNESRVTISTPYPSEGTCIRYDIRIFVPPNLKKLHVAAHTIAHVQFDPESHITLDDFFITLFSMSAQNMVLPHNNLRSKKMAIEVFEGWIVGDAAIVSSTKITTQRGSGVMNVRVHPTEPIDPAIPEVASLRTTSGSGRTDVFYIGSHVHRPISSVHMSSRNADMYLTYRDAQYSGRVELESSSYTATNLQRLDASGDGKWTHWAGDQNGKDVLFVKSRKWVGLYF
ncbi:hypothetical protein B0H15DRAFT_388373 [Mycena belliarum]|uniref:Uncharacterized protein n=1 Tax=Mycena belliarum TaxID=1033014 RepID=A0AAD6TYK6_9AGAR|nr:hypothetical protein B0H15DRAFT_388373 [Mycena belliae]